jgi:hypothetical protein
MPRKKQTEEVKPIGETVDELSSPKVILDATLPPELEQEVAKVEESNESAGASIIEAVEPPPVVETPPAIPETVETVVVGVEPETVTVNKKALYRLVQALNRNQIHMYIGTAATRFLGDLFTLETLAERNEKWNEVKKWNEENR